MKTRRGVETSRWKNAQYSQKERKSVEYKLWREMIFERNNYVCQKCGQVGKNLNAHHIVSYSLNEKLRLNIDNGITLCKKCHDDFHNIYGKMDFNKTELSKFLN